MQRAPRPVSSENKIEVVVPNNVINTLKAAENDKQINRHANYYDFIDLYKQKGINLDLEYEKKPKTAYSENIKDQFLNNTHGSFAANLAEALPLYANKQGRVGDYLNINVTRTAKQDDQGNSFVDLVIEVKNNWIVNGAPEELQDVPAKMIFLVDVTTSTGGEKYEHKISFLKNQVLALGQRANVLCYKDEQGNLGIDRPKILVQQSASNLESLGNRLGECIAREASDKFTITNPDTFDKLYREYFFNLMNSIAENAASNSNYIKSLSADPKRALLAKEYDKMVKFIEAYKKTPVTKKLAS